MGNWFSPRGPAKKAICDQMLDEPAGAARLGVTQAAGEPDLVCRSTVLNVVHEEWTALLGAIRARAGETLGAPGRPPAPAGVAVGRRWWSSLTM